MMRIARRPVARERARWLSSLADDDLFVAMSTTSWAEASAPDPDGYEGGGLLNSRFSAAEYTASLTNTKATDIFIGLKYWARATRYDPTPSEQQVLEACAERSSRNWMAGLVVGAASGLAACYRLTAVRGIQRFVLSSTGAAVGSLAGQFYAHAPCLCEIYALGEREHSPLAQQAAFLHSFSKGSVTTREERAALTRRVEDQVASKQRAAAALEARPVEDTDPIAVLASSVEAPPPAPAQKHASWAEIRAKYQAGGRSLSASSTPQQQEPPERIVGAGRALPPPPPPQVDAPSGSGSGRGPRPARRNAYGDIID